MIRLNLLRDRTGPAVRKTVLVLNVPRGWVQVYSDGSGFTIPLHHSWPLLLNILGVAAAV